MTEETIHVCIDRVLTPDQAVDAAERAIEENPSNVPILRPGVGIAPPSRMELAALTGKLWQNGRTLRVRFLDGPAAVRAKVETIAHIWSQSANITFEFGDLADAELRVSFNQRGSWSYIGTDALAIPKAEPTINFGWLTTSSSDDEYNRVVLHELGHALGCIHEHQNPSASIPWNKEAVYAYYAGPPNNWSRADVDNNLFRTYSRSLTQFSDFDRESIMLYPIPKEHTIGGYEVGWNRHLSPTDKQFIGVLYPFDAVQATLLTIDGPAVEESIGKHGEEDLFRFEVVAAGNYRVETRGWTDVVMALLGPNNQTNVIAEDDDSGRNLNARIIAALEPGAYYVRVRHFRPKGTGKYKIMVNSVQ